MKIRGFEKFWAATVGVAFQVLSTVTMPDGWRPWPQIGIAVLTALGVHQTANTAT